MGSTETIHLVWLIHLVTIKQTHILCDFTLCTPSGQFSCTQFWPLVATDVQCSINWHVLERTFMRLQYVRHLVFGQFSCTPFWPLVATDVQCNIIPYKHSVIFVSATQANSADPDQTPQQAASDQGLHSSLTECSIKFQLKIKEIPPNSRLNGNGLAQLITVGNSIRNKRVNWRTDGICHTCCYNKDCIVHYIFKGITGRK